LCHCRSGALDPACRLWRRRFGANMWCLSPRRPPPRRPPPHRSWPCLCTCHLSVSICGREGSDRAQLAWTVSDGPGFVRSYTTHHPRAGVRWQLYLSPPPITARRRETGGASGDFCGSARAKHCEMKATRPRTGQQYAGNRPRRLRSHGYQSVMDGARVRFHVEDAPSHLRRTEWIAETTVPP
jgi:hypothetical protein